jgi:hypothetical protein
VFKYLDVKELKYHRAGGKLYNEKLRNAVKIIKQKGKMGETCSTWGMKNEYKILVGTLKRRTTWNT